MVAALLYYIPTKPTPIIHPQKIQGSAADLDRRDEDGDNDNDDDDDDGEEDDEEIGRAAKNAKNNGRKAKKRPIKFRFSMKNLLDYRKANRSVIANMAAVADAEKHDAQIISPIITPSSRKEEGMSFAFAVFPTESDHKPRKFAVGDVVEIRERGWRSALITNKRENGTYDVDLLDKMTKKVTGNKTELEDFKVRWERENAAFQAFVSKTSARRAVDGGVMDRQLDSIEDEVVGFQSTLSKRNDLADNRLKEAEDNLQMAILRNIAGGNDATLKAVQKARKDKEAAELGPRMKFVTNKKDIIVDGDIWVHLAGKSSREDRTGTSRVFVKNFRDLEVESTQLIVASSADLPGFVRRAETMKRAVNANLSKTDVDKNCYDILIALSNQDEGEGDEKTCPICFDNLGSTYALGIDRGGAKKMPPNIAMVHCGGPHFLCAACLDEYNQSKGQGQGVGSKATCIECRQDYDPILDVTLIKLNPKNHDKDNQRMKEARNAKVKELRQWLSLMSGSRKRFEWIHSAPEDALQVFDLPPNVSVQRISKHPAIAGSAAAHLRASVRMQLPVMKKNFVPHEFIPGSKTNRLLLDLPLDERSVVFTSSKNYVIHLSSVLFSQGIGNVCLYTGQKQEENAEALSLWKSADMEHLVLIVQAGAAASGLTLVDACKIFVMDAIHKEEEQKQIEARCHRFGQKNPVTVVNYFSPVSVESRIFSLRSDIKDKGTKVEAAEMEDGEDELVDSEDEDEGVIVVDENDSDDEGNNLELARKQTRRNLYLIGLINSV